MDGFSVKDNVYNLKCQTTFLVEYYDNHRALASTHSHCAKLADEQEAALEKTGPFQSSTHHGTSSIYLIS